MKLSYSPEEEILLYNNFNIIVEGFKSIMNETKLNIKPLTILAGSNSSGKSSIMKPMLLLKQTIDESYDPGALLLNGPNVKFNEAEELLHKSKYKKSSFFTVGIEINDSIYKIVFTKNDQNKPGFKVKEIITNIEKNKISLTKGLSKNMIDKLLPEEEEDFINDFILDKVNPSELNISVERNRCFLDVEIFHEKDGKKKFGMSPQIKGKEILQKMLNNMIYLPGLRGNPARNYPTTLVDTSIENVSFKGTFEKYIASIINYWQNNKKSKINDLEEKLNLLKLGSSIQTKLIKDTKISILVGRLSNRKIEFDNIADVGLGVSQTLPVLVALLYAKPSQIVYIEQPEIHLHPNAQYKLAELIAETSNRGVFVVVETHSSILIKGLQTLIAKNRIDREKVNLHWFKKDLDNSTSEIISAQIKKDGSFGDWPEDFDDIEFYAETEYLNAVEQLGDNHEK